MTKHHKTNCNNKNPKIEFNAITENQQLYYDAIKNNKITFGIGPAGVGKTLVPTLFGLKLLIEKQVDKFIISRPIIEAGNSIGYLPGTYDEKLSPYIQPIQDIIDIWIGREQVLDLMSCKKIETIPINYMRGRTFSNSFILLDEMQNCTYDQIILALTRFGKYSKMVLTADCSQSDLPKSIQGGLENIISKLKNVKDVGIVTLEKKDIVREPIVATILEKLHEKSESSVIKR